MLYIKSHTHMNLLRKGFIFAAEPAPLAPYLARSPVGTGPVGGNQLPLEATGHATFGSLEATLARRGGLSLKCSFTPNYLKRRDGWYDRAPSIACDDWSFLPGGRPPPLGHLLASRRQLTSGR